MTFVPVFAAFALSIVVAVSSNPVEAKTCEEPDNITFVQGERHCLAIETFSSTSRPDTLVVTLHGGLSRGGTADYMVRFAREVSELGVSAVAMMHPGYTGAGRTSSGRAARDRHRDDRFRKREIDSIASALEKLKTHHGAKRLILVGHTPSAPSSRASSSVDTPTSPTPLFSSRVPAISTGGAGVTDESGWRSPNPRTGTSRR